MVLPSESSSYSIVDYDSSHDSSSSTSSDGTHAQAETITEKGENTITVNIKYHFQAR